ncbi:MAG: hypothetical protein MUC49_14980 [Raineya sp.]|jgi:hypothetical protein|nr:hypothetical protein [Raineya sp.]
MTTKYYRTYNESHYGDVGYYYCEVHNQTITRQIVSFENHLYWATPSNCNNDEYDFTDQPDFLDSDLSQLKEHNQLIELTKEEFEGIWEKAIYS